MPSKKDQERRRTSRVALNAQVRYTPSAQGSRGARLRIAEGINISQGGLCIKTKAALGLSQIIRLNLPVNGATQENATDAAMTPTLAECCWIKPQQGQYEVGLRFLL